MSYYERVEQETVYNYSAIDGDWRIYSTYPPHIRKLLEYAVIANKTTDGSGRVISVDGNVDKNQVRLFRPR
ncbi:hypothetical protein [Aquibacillus saliphilus]|uniref:hypothetical protein n=1 Tax=Aquibacillus saliphilus TaxID=1909422 RepID=UPI001CF0A2D9|nr:hypothetical protein [Aquibacillus saliphilus]